LFRPVHPSPSTRYLDARHDAPIPPSQPWSERCGASPPRLCSVTTMLTRAWVARARQLGRSVADQGLDGGRSPRPPRLLAGSFANAFVAGGPSRLSSPRRRQVVCRSTACRYVGLPRPQDSLGRRPLAAGFQQHPVGNHSRWHPRKKKKTQKKRNKKEGRRPRRRSWLHHHASATSPQQPRRPAPTRSAGPCRWHQLRRQVDRHRQEEPTWRWSESMRQALGPSSVSAIFRQARIGDWCAIRDPTASAARSARACLSARGPRHRLRPYDLPAIDVPHHPAIPRPLVRPHGQGYRACRRRSTRHQWSAASHRLAIPRDRDQWSTTCGGKEPTTAMSSAACSSDIQPSRDSSPSMASDSHRRADQSSRAGFPAPRPELRRLRSSSPPPSTAKPIKKNRGFPGDHPRLSPMPAQARRHPCGSKAGADRRRHHQRDAGDGWRRATSAEPKARSSGVGLAPLITSTHCDKLGLDTGGVKASRLPR